MAKRISPFSSDDTPENFGAVVRTYSFGNVDIAAYAATMPTLTPEQLADIAARFTAAAASWAVLHTWKKVRWSLCAITTYGDAITLQGAQGWSGYSLYIKSYMQQHTEAGKQPISPCSARATDPGASPWNYQP